jgi:TIR domain/Sel1 repeat
MNAKVFINYRREDTAPYAGRVYDRLTAHFGEDQVFIDIDQIEPGEDFVEAINRKVSACDIAIVAIGPDWLHATDASGKRRLDDEEDFVRMEIVAALQRKIRVIPVLVGGAQMPRKQDLPEALAPLSRRNAIELSETRFHADVNRLIEAIEKSGAVVEKRVDLSATHAAPPPEPTAVRPESKDLPEPSESTKPTEAKKHKDIHGDAISGPIPAPTRFLSEGMRFPANLRTVFISKRGRLIIGGAIVLLLLTLVGVLVWSHHQKPAKQANQPAIASPERVAPNLQRVAPNLEAVVPNPKGLSNPAEPKSIDQGNYATNFEIGRRYEKGEGVPQDYRKAAEFFQKAADRGNAEAQDNLGWLYEHGRGVPQDYRKAAEFFQKAADRGNARAQDRLGWLYEHGRGVPEDLEKAKELYQKAADQGNEAAIANLKKLSGLRK